MMSLWLLNIYMDLVLKEVRMRFSRRGIQLFKNGICWTYGDDFVLVAESEFELRVMIEC